MGSGRYVNYLGDDKNSAIPSPLPMDRTIDACRSQSEIRSAELFPRELEHPSTGVNRLIRG